MGWVNFLQRVRGYFDGIVKDVGDHTTLSFGPGFALTDNADARRVEVDLDIDGILADREGPWKPYADTATMANIDVTAPPAVIEGIAVSFANQRRVLLAGQTNPIQNGIYTKAEGGSLVRALDADSEADIKGARITVTSGTYAGIDWYCSNVGSARPGIDPLTWKRYCNGAIVDGLRLPHEGTQSITCETPPGTLGVQPQELLISAASSAPDYGPPKGIRLYGGNDADGGTAGPITVDLGWSVPGTTASFRLQSRDITNANPADFLGMYLDPNGSTIRSEQDLTIQFDQKMSIEADNGNIVLLDEFGVLTFGTSGVTCITSISRSAQSYTSPGATLTLDFDVTRRSVVRFTPNQNLTISASNGAENGEYVFILKQPAGANYTVSWSATRFKFGALSNTATAVNGAMDIWVFILVDGVFRCTAVTKGVQ